MFNPSLREVRSFFVEAWRKRRSGAVASPMDAMAADWVASHPEYHADIESPGALDADYEVGQGRTNPFLHLSMHLAISEQLSIDQPPGIRAAFDALAARLDSPHDAAHEVMECLGRVIWESQRNGTMPDNDGYLDCIRRRASQ